jgi:pimeloyl-ACP methyl ester carboxylesterase
MIIGPYRRSGRAFVALLVAVVVALVLGLLMPRRAHAQPRPSAFTFVYLLGADTVAIETVTPGDGIVKGVLAYRGQPRLEWEQQRTPLRLTLQVFAAGADASAAPLQVASFTQRGDSIAAELGARGAMRPQLFASKVGAVPLINNSVLQAALMAQYARSLGRTTLPVFLTAGAQTLDATVAFAGDTSVFTLADMPMHTVWADGVPRETRIAAQNLRVVMADRAVPPLVPEKIDYTAPAGAPYTAEAVTIPTSRGYTLAGTLTMPRGARKAPVVITISGSGPQERDSRIPMVKGYAPFRDLADTLGRRGIAVLRYDDRGVGASGGADSRDAATSSDFADDVLAVVAYLRTRADIDGARIGLAGHSEGGIIAPLAATKDPTVRAVVLLAAPAYDGRRILEYQNENGIRAAPGLTDRQRDSVRRMVPAALNSLQRTNAWMRYFMTHDPLVTARALRQPVLIVQGDTDMQVTPEQADTLAATMRTAGNRAVTLRRFPATNHLLLPDPSGAPQGYASLRDVRVRAEVLGTVADWFVTTFR